MNTMPAAYAAKESLLEALLAPAMLTMQLPEGLTPEYLPPDAFFHAMDSMEGIELAHLLAPPGRSALLARGALGAHSPRVSIKQEVWIHVLHGALLWWQSSLGEDPQRVEAGQVMHLKPNETHGFVVLEDCLNYNVFSPALR